MMGINTSKQNKTEKTALKKIDPNGTKRVKKSLKKEKKNAISLAQYFDIFIL